MDLWSLGVITYILWIPAGRLTGRLCGYPPFPQSNDFAALRAVVSGAFQFHLPQWASVSEEAKEFIAALLVPSPHARATAKQACAMRWMQFESTRTMHMNSAVQQLARFNARRKDRAPCREAPVAPRRCAAQFVSLVACGVRDNPSLARGLTSRIPARGAAARR